VAADGAYAELSISLGFSYNPPFGATALFCRLLRIIMNATNATTARVPNIAPMTIPAIAPPEIPLLVFVFPPTVFPAAPAEAFDPSPEDDFEALLAEVLLVEEVEGDSVEKTLGVDCGRLVTIDADGKALNSFAAALAGLIPLFGFVKSLGMQTFIWLGVVVHNSASPQHHCRAFDFPHRIWLSPGVSVVPPRQLTLNPQQFYRTMELDGCIQSMSSVLVTYWIRGWTRKESVATWNECAYATICCVICCRKGIGTTPGT
jgi:hypothetical protein